MAVFSTNFLKYINSFSLIINGIIISGFISMLILLDTSIDDSNIDLTCISYISGNVTPSLQPLWPNIGFCSSNCRDLERT